VTGTRFRLSKVVSSQHFGSRGAKSMLPRQSNLKIYWPGLLAIGLVASLIYVQGIANGFVAEDFDWLAFSRSGSDASAYLAFQFRPLPVAAVFLIQALAGMNPIVYHFVSILLHVGCAIWVFYLMLLLTENRPVSLIGALIFAIYPRHHEPVMWMASNNTLWASCFYLLALLGFILFLKRDNHLFLWGSLVAFVLALLSNEMAVMLPLVLFCLEFILFSAEGKQTWRKLRSLRKYVPYFVILFAYGLFLLYSQGQSMLSTTSSGYHWSGQLVRQLKTFASYVVYLIFPHIPLRSLDINVPVMLLAVGTSLGLLFVFWKGPRLGRFWLVWIVLTLIPFVFFVPFGNADRYFYLPSVGFSGLLVEIGLWVFQGVTGGHKRIVKILVIVILSGYVLGSFIVIQQQIKDWQEAGIMAQECIEQVQALYPDLAAGDQLYVGNLPARHGYATVFLGGGFQGAMHLVYGDPSIKVFVTRDPTILAEINSSTLRASPISNTFVLVYDGQEIIDRTANASAFASVLSRDAWYFFDW